MVFMKNTVFLLVILVFLPISIYADQTVLSIINNKEFKSCFLGFCQNVAPPFLLTDINFTYANYSYISVYSNYTDYANQSNFSYYVNNDTERTLFNNTYNITYDSKISDNTSFNQSMLYQLFVNLTYYNTNPFGYITSSFNSSYNTQLGHNTTNEIFTVCNNNTFAFKNEPLWTNNYTSLNSSWSNIYNQTYHLKFNTTATENLNMSTKNITFYLVSASSPTCIKDYNTTGHVKFCDCYNNTHKWVGNTC